MSLILIALKVISGVFFFFLVKKYFDKLSTALFLTIFFLISPWQTQINQEKLVFVLLLSILFFLIVTLKKELLNLKSLFVIFVLLFLPSLLLTINGFQIKTTPINLNQESIGRIILYQNILNPINPTISRLYTNKATEIVKILEINFFESFDLNHYFFANHPMERVTVTEKEKLYSGLLPFFLVGFFSLNLPTFGPILVWVSFVFLLSSYFANRNFNIEILLMVPFLLVIGLGLEKIRSIKKKWLKTFIMLPIFVWLIIEIIILALQQNLYF